MSLSFEQFVDRLRASSLMSREDIETFVDSLSPQDQPQDGEQLARLLVQQQKLTAFQAKQIYSGNQKSLVLGNYIVLDKLGQGGMGMVLKAEHRRMHRLVALKILSPKATNSPAAAKRFHREVEAAAKLEHPNIVTAYDADESDGTHFLVMQYVEGKDLSALVKKKGPLAVDKAVNCILQAARGLQYAHEQGVVHRDIKPANLLVNDKGTVQILDMGLARLENTGGNPDQAELTSTGQIMGTVDYMAPEQALSTKDADARSDIYSLGITLWYLLTGRAAYDGDNLTAKLLAHQQAPIPSLSAANSAVPAQLDDLFRKMVAKDRNERHQSMAEVIADLERCLAPTASAPTITSATSEDSKFHAFLENLDADKSQATLASSDQQQITAEQQPKTEHAATISYDSSTEETNHQIDVKQSQSEGTLSKAVPTSKRSIDWRNPRLQIGAAAVALLLLVVGLIWGLNNGSNQDAPQGSGKSQPPGSPPPLAIAPFTADKAREYQESWAKYLGVDLEKRVELPGGKTMSFVLIPPGEFTMGSPNDGSQSKDVSRRVKISKPFYLAKYELTQAEWLAVMGNNPSQFKGDLSLPVESVRWDDSKDLLSQLNAGIAKDGMTFLLPTEAQWEYACRAGTTERWHFGDNESLLSEYGVFKNNSVGGTHAVGSGKPNPWGLYDMYGNVWEWCADWHSEFESEPDLLQDPVGPESGERRVNRGGSWSAHAYSCRSAYRAHNPPTEAYGGIGFRLALTIESPDAGNDFSPTVPESKPPPLAVAPFDKDRAEQHQEAWAKYLEIPVEFTNELGITFRLIPPGEFTMGSSKEAVAQYEEEIKQGIADATIKSQVEVSHFYPELLGLEFPEHRVTIDRPFYLGTHEVTQKQYKAITGTNPSRFQGDERRIADLDTSQHPVDKVNWHEAVEFCNQMQQNELGTKNVPLSGFYRLPSEDEWEYACKAGTTTRFWTGDDAKELRTAAWFGVLDGHTHPVGELRPNPYGLFDVHGNVFEWCRDPFVPYSESENYDSSALQYEMNRAYRGGSWRTHSSTCRSAMRDRYEAKRGLSTAGFRVALTIESPKLPPPRARAPFDSGKANKLQTAWAKYLNVPIEKQVTLPGGELLNLVLIPPGEFHMGSSHWGRQQFLAEAQKTNDQWSIERIPSEGPHHRVKISRPFYLGKYELTQAQWESVTGNNPSKHKDDPRNPVDTVSWSDIQTYIATLNNDEPAAAGYFFLPTEAQWEYACRSGTEGFWYSGNDVNAVAEYGWFDDNSGGRPHPVGMLKPNAWRLHDMHGNAWEWCADFYSPEYYRESPVVDPTGPAVSSFRSHRGGSWYVHPWRARSAYRYEHVPEYSQFNHGFRLAMAVESDKLPPLIKHAPPPIKTDHALAFNGKDSYVEIPTLRHDGSRPITIEAIIYHDPQDWDERKDFDTIPGQGHLRDDVLLGLADRLGIAELVISGTARNWEAKEALSSGWSRTRLEMPVSAGWTHIADVFHKRRHELYVNGTLVETKQYETGTVAPTFGADKYTTSIGASLVATEKSRAKRHFKGRIADVRISNGARYQKNFEPLRPSDRFTKVENTVALYHFDEGEGTQLTDSSGNNHHGKIVNASWVTTDSLPIASKPDRALMFDGTAHVNIPTLKIASPPQLTVEAIVKAKSPHRGMIVSNAGRAGFGFKIGNDRWKFDGYGMQSKFAVFADQKAAYNKWTHVAAVIDGKQVRLFVDGQMQQETATIDQLKPSAAWVAIGANPEANGIAEPFRGAVRMVRISKSARYQSSFQVPASFDKDINTLALYNFHQGRGSELLDSSGNNHHGNIVNALWVNLANTPPIDPERTVAEQVIQAGGYLSLQIDDDGQSSPKTVKQIDHLPKESFVLRAIYLSNVKGIGDDQLRHLANLRGLVEIHLHNTAVTDKGLQHLQSIESLNNINLYGTQVTDEGLKTLDGLPFLHSLSLTSTPAQQSGISGLKSLRTLRRLLVSNSISSQRILELSQATQLRELDIYGEAPHVTPALVDEFQKQNPHCRIRISNGNPVGRDPVRELAQWVQQVGGNLTLADYAPDAGYKQFGKSDPLPPQQFRIRTIDLSECSELVDDDLKRLTAAVFLHDLRLSRTNISDAGIAQLRTSPTLGSIWLDDTNVTDTSLQQLAAMPRVSIYYLQGSQVTSGGLKFLVDGPPLQWLNIGGPQVNSEALNHVSRQVRLRSLVMTNGEIGDKEIQQLATLKSLEKLDLTGTLVTKAGVEQLAAKLPQCRITYGPPEAKVTIGPQPEK